MSLSVALPFLSLALLAAVLARRRGDWRVAAVEAAALWGAFLALSTEALSLLRLVSRGGVAGVWAAAALGLGAWLARTPREGTPAAGGARPAELLSAGSRALLGGVAALLALVAVTALVAPPNNFDSMNYHLPRVVQWIQRRSVEHFPTYYLPQLEHPPLTEFAVLHLQVLYGGDRFANLVQWLALVGSAVSASLVARELGAGLRAQVIAAVVVVTLPIAILQGSNTKNDVTLSFWLVTFAFFALRAMRAERPGILEAGWMGLGVGLALFTKGTAYILAAPLCLWVALALLRRLGIGVWRPGLVVTGIVLLLNGGYYLRNTALFGRPISNGGDAAGPLRTLPGLASTVLKNLSVHLGTPVASVNAGIDGTLRAAHRGLGLDPSDPRTTSWGAFEFHAMNTHEDTAGNPLHLLLSLAAVPVLAARRRLRGRIASYVLTVGASAALFCLVLKYQPQITRFHTPLFLLAAPVVALSLEAMARVRQGQAVAALLLLASVPWVLFNGTRPLVSVTTRKSGHRASILQVDRYEQYFANRNTRHLLEPYRRMAEVVREQRGDVGLLLPEGAIEYPLWVLLESGDGPRTLGNVGVLNRSRAAVAPGERFDPEIVIRVRERYFTHAPSQPWEGTSEGLEALRLPEGSYARRWAFGPVDVFVREDLAGDPRHERGRGSP